MGRGLAWPLPILIAGLILLGLPAIGQAQAPAQPTGLTPSGVSVTPGTQPTLSWAPATGATSYQIKFGQTNPPPLFGATSETSITLGTIIQSNMIYYWQVIAVNSSGQTASAIASFTGGTGGGLPAAVTVFSPATGATNVDPNVTLMWGAVAADSYDVYFGTTSPPPPITNTTSTSFTPGTLAANTTYYWQVNSRNSAGATQSAVQTFSTGPTIGNGAPSPVTVVTPVSGQSNVPIGSPLTWQAASGATSYNVSFGTSNPPPLVVSGTTALSYSPSLAANTTYYWQVAAVNASGTTNSSVFFFSTGTITNTGALRFIPVTPCRVLDTRGAFGVFGGPMMPANSSRDVPIPSGPCGIPATAQAYSLNVTAVPPGQLTYLTVWPSGQTQPNVSTLNSFDGRIVANAAIVPAGTNGSITMYASNQTHVILDIDGYFVPANTVNSLPFNALTPCRVVDTRSATLGALLGAPFMSGGTTRSFPLLSSSCGIPSSALAYSLNITVVPRTTLGFLTTWPTGQAQPGSSTLNSSDGAVVANAAIVPAGSGGAINVFVQNDTDVIIDVNGYFGQPTTSSAQSNLSLYTLTPCRVADTRGNGFTGLYGPPPFLANTVRVFPMYGQCSVPSTAQAFSLNFTVLPNGPLNFMTAWPQGQPQPAASTLNSSLGKVVANAALVPSGIGGAISVYSSNATDLVLDINAYFAP